MTETKPQGSALDFKEFRGFIMASTKDIQSSMQRPDDDWTPVGIIQNEAGVGIIGIDPKFLQNSATKDALVQQMINIIKETKARKFGMVMSSWAMTVKTEALDVLDPALDLPPPAESPDRYEMLNITVMDEERCEVWTAKINRTDDAPPTLDEYEMLEVGTSTGRFVEPLQSALR